MERRSPDRHGEGLASRPAPRRGLDGLTELLGAALENPCREDRGAR